MPEVKGTISEKMRLIRWRMTREESRLADEIRLIPRWLYKLVIVLFVLAHIIAQLLNKYHKPVFPNLPPALGALALAGGITGVGIAVAILILLFGYINRDARRRGMNSTLWTLLAIFVPNLIGVIIYFLVREPLRFNCPQCSATVSARFNFCPNCKYNLRPTCPECKREVRPEDHYCPHCAHELAAAPR